MLPIKISGSHLELTEAIKSYVEGKFESLHKMAGGDVGNSHLQIVLSKTTNHHQHGDIFEAEVRLRMYGYDFVLSKQAGDLYSAIDMVRDEALADVRTYHDKKMHHSREGARELKESLHGNEN